MPPPSDSWTRYRCFRCQTPWPATAVLLLGERICGPRWTGARTRTLVRRAVATRGPDATGRTAPRERPRSYHRLPDVVTLLAAALLFGPPATAAQPLKPVKIGILTMAWAPWHPTTVGFRDALRKLGYVEGQTVTFVARAAQGDTTHLRALAAELLAERPDLLLCVAPPAAQACQAATRSLPIVFAEAGDPVRLGLVTSIAHPGGNLTGIGNLQEDLTAKRLELFKEAVPSLRRVLVTYDPRELEQQAAVAEARLAARRLRLTLLERPITDPLEIEPGLAGLKRGGRDGILLVQQAGQLNIPLRSLEVAISKGLPTMYPNAFWPGFGALASYGPNQELQGGQAARLAYRILTGTPPRELPVELPDRIEFVLNLKTARRLGLTVPQDVLMRADRIIQ